jgi:CRP/FNR family transcriptional regulator
MSFLGNLPPLRYVLAGTVLLEQGCMARSVHLIERGVVKLVHLSARGRETAIGLRSDGWYAGSTSALLNAPSVYTVQTVTDCMVARVPCAEFQRYLSEDHAMMDHFFAGLCFEVASQASLQVEMMAGTAEDRLEHFMRERKTVNPGRQTLDPLPMLKQMELAQLLSMTPEHLSRLLHKSKRAARQAAGAEARKAPKKRNYK